MDDSFDPYREWLGISDKIRSPDHYQLLGVARFETDLDRIQAEYDERMRRVRTFQTGPKSALSQQILTELSIAKVCLLDPKRREKYDRVLRAKIAAPAEKEKTSAKTPSQQDTAVGAGSPARRWFLPVAAAASLLLLVGTGTFVVSLFGNTDHPAVVLPKVPAEDPERPDEQEPVVLPESGIPEVQLAEVRSMTVTASAQLALPFQLAPDGDLPESVAARLVNGPEGMAVDPASKTIRWRPDRYHGTQQHDIVLQIFDPATNHVLDEKPFTVNVRGVNHPPIVERLYPLRTEQGQTVTAQVTARDPDNEAALKYSLIEFPHGAVIDGASGDFTWTPPVRAMKDAVTTYIVRIKVEEDTPSGLSVERGFPIVVARKVATADGRGLIVSVFRSNSATELVERTIDPRLDRFWGPKRPAGITDDFFFVRWTGWLRPPVAGKYKLTIFAPGAATLRIADQDILLAPQGGSGIRWVINVDLENKPYPISLDYQARGGYVVAQLRWQIPGMKVTRLVPAEALFHRESAAAEAANIPIPAEPEPGEGLEMQSFSDTELLESSGMGLGVDVDHLAPNETASSRYQGFLRAATPGDYEFVLLFSGQAKVWVDDQLVVDRWDHVGFGEARFQVKLEDRRHPLRIETARINEPMIESLRWLPASANGDLRLAAPVPISMLSHDKVELAKAFAAPVESPIKEKPPITEKLPLPKEHLRNAALGRLRQIFSEAYAKTHPVDRVDLAMRLLSASGANSDGPARRYVLPKGLAKNEDDPAFQYVMLEEAARLAGEGGDAPLAWKALDQIMDRFAVESVLRQKTDTLLAASELDASREEYQQRVKMFLTVLAETEQAGKYQKAVKLIAPAASAASNSKDRDLRIALQKRSKHVRRIDREHRAVQKAVLALKQNPKDAKANYQYGRFLALYANDWEAALPLLAKGDHDEFQLAAFKSLASPHTDYELFVLGDHWWALGDKETGIARLALYEQAIAFYQRISGETTTLEQRVIDKRMEAYQQMKEHSSPPAP